MATNSPSNFNKLFSHRDLFRGHARFAWAWSAAAAALLWPLMLDCGLFAGILIERGRLSEDLSRDEIAQFTSLTGLSVESNHESPPDPSEAAKATNAAENPVPKEGGAVRINFEDQGILPAVWHSRGHWWGSGMASLFRRVEWLRSNLLATILLLVLGAVLTTLRAWCLSRQRLACQRAALQISSHPRRNLHRQVMRLSPEDLDGTGRDLAANLFTSEVETLRRGVASWMVSVTRYPLELACIAIVVMSLQPMLAAQALLLVGVIGYLLDVNRQHAEHQRRLAADRAAGELRVIVDGFGATKLARGLGIEQLEHDQFASQLHRYNELAIQEDRTAELARYPRPLVVAITSIVIAFLLYLLAIKILLLRSELTAAAGGSIVVAWITAVQAFSQLHKRWHSRHEATLAAEAIQRYLDQIPSVGQAVGAKFYEPVSRTIHFDSVVYRQSNGRLLLDGIDLKLNAGRTYSLVSVDPLEARALASMLPRFIEPQQGRVLYDGEDIAWATLESLRAETVFVGADDLPLAATVLDNLRGGRNEYTLQQATDAAKTVHAHHFIVKLPNGYETLLTGRDDTLDVGQRFRLSLARAILRNPAVLIIEEPRENLDEDTKNLLADTYDRICRNRTVIFLPARLPTVRRSDEVVVLHEGRIAAVGPQSKLVGGSAIYRHWEYLHFNEFRRQE